MKTRKQHGFALVLMVAVFIMAFGWYALGAFNSALTQGYERDQVTATALKKAKEALLAYVAMTAAMTSDTVDSRHANPGRLPCPEALSHAGTANDGVAADLTSGYACASVGRLPWKSLGVDQIRDGYGEPLWYAVPQNASWAKSNSSTTLTINPGLANQLSYDGTTSVVAVIIAPGPAINTLNQSGTPPGGCSAVNQQSATRNSTLVVTNFLECGNATGSYATIGTSPWSNDRTISITAAEVMDAVAGAVADRLQRQVAPTLNDWRSTESLSQWGRTFLPYASSFNVTPTTNDLCGNAGTNEGVLPTAGRLSGTCSTAWSTFNASGAIAGSFCNYLDTQLQCWVWASGVGGTSFSTHLTATAPNVASSFRRAITSSDVAATDLFGAATSVTNFSLSLNPANGVATVGVDVSATIAAIGWVFFQVTINTLPDANILSDARLTWFTNNGWTRYTYYQLSTAASVNPGANICNAAGDPACLTLANLPSSNGNTNDKRLMLALLGRAVTGQTQPSAAPTDYLESHTAGTTTFTKSSVTSSYNDRLAACPFQVTFEDSTTSPICN